VRRGAISKRSRINLDNFFPFTKVEKKTGKVYQSEFFPAEINYSFLPRSIYSRK
jgi:hypothetical protein